MQCARLLSLIVLVSALAAGCTHYQPAVHIAYLPGDAFTVSEDVLREVMKDDGSVPEQYWGASLPALKPLRVHDDRLNIAVVTEERGDEERGFYFYRPISSYLPVDAPGRRFRWNAKTEQLGYVFTTKE